MVYFRLMLYSINILHSKPFTHCRLRDIVFDVQFSGHYMNCCRCGGMTLDRGIFKLSVSSQRGINQSLTIHDHVRQWGRHPLHLIAYIILVSCVNLPGFNIPTEKYVDLFCSLSVYNRFPQVYYARYKFT